MPTASESRPYYKIHDLPEGTRPRERLARLGASSLSDAELIAIVLRSGTPGLNVLDMATEIVRSYRNLAGLAKVNFEELCTHHGVGEAKAAQILAALELGRRMMLANPEVRPQVRSAEEAARLLMPELAYADQEHVKVILIDTRNVVIATPTIYKGTLNSASVRIGEIFKEAIRRNAAAVIVAHNHPSGDPSPSPEDIVLTRRIIEAGDLLGVEVLDHIVLGHQRWVSLKEKGLGFTK